MTVSYFADLAGTLQCALDARARPVAQFLDQALCGPVNHLFPFVRKVRWDLSRRKSHLSMPSATMSKDKKTAFLNIPLGAEAKWAIRLHLCATRSIFQSHKDTSKGHLIWLADATARRLYHGVSAIARVEKPSTIMSALATSLGDGIVASFLRRRFELTFDARRLLVVLAEISRETYENRRLSQGVLITATEKSTAPDFLRLMRDHKKQLLPTSDGYRTAVLISRNGRLRRIEDIEEQAKDLEAGPSPVWFSPLASLTGKREEYLIGLALNRQGDILVAAFGRLLLSYRRGSWRTYDHASFINVIQEVLAATGFESDARRYATLLYLVTLDVSFARTGALFGVLKPDSDVGEYVSEHDLVGPKGRGFLSAMRKVALSDFSRPVIAAFAGIDGAMVVDSKGHLISIGAIVRAGASSASSDAGARTRAACRLSETGIALKVSSDGDVSLFVDGKLHTKLL